MVEPFAFQAEITLLPLEAGGRQGAIASGYRAPIAFGLQDDTGVALYHESIITLLTVASLRPGATALAEVRVPDGGALWATIHPQATFKIAEGPRHVVGRGIVLQVPSRVG